MEKGSKRKLDIQRTTKKLITEKGYSAVTMSDVSESLGLSAGGLYYHYHSIEEIFLDIVENETNDVWNIFSQVNGIDDLADAFQAYRKVETKDMLNFENTLNSIFYQYYFSFPADIRKEKMQKAYIETISSISAILRKVYKSSEHVTLLSNHIYVMLNGLNVLATTGQINEILIKNEFDETEKLMRKLYAEGENRE